MVRISTSYAASAAAAVLCAMAYARVRRAPVCKICMRDDPCGIMGERKLDAGLARCDARAYWSDAEGVHMEECWGLDVTEGWGRGGCCGSFDYTLHATDRMADMRHGDGNGRLSARDVSRICYSRVSVYCTERDP